MSREDRLDRSSPSLEKASLFWCSWSNWISPKVQAKPGQNTKVFSFLHHLFLFDFLIKFPYTTIVPEKEVKNLKRSKSVRIALCVLGLIIVLVDIYVIHIDRGIPPIIAGLIIAIAGTLFLIGIAPKKSQSEQ